MKPKIAVIVAKASDHGIGCSDGLPWHIPGELRYFRDRTLGKPVIMGRRTFVSIIEQFKKPLPNRTNIVVSRSGFSHEAADAVLSSLEEAIRYAQDVAEKNNLNEIFVIGGAEIFKQALTIADVVYLTKIHGEFKTANSFLEEEYIPNNIWEKNEALSKTEVLKEIEFDKDVTCEFLVLERREDKKQPSQTSR